MIQYPKRTGSLTVTKGKYTYQIHEITRDDKRHSKIYVARRSDSKSPVGTTYQSKSDLKRHYNSIAAEIEKAF